MSEAFALAAQGHDRSLATRPGGRYAPLLSAIAAAFVVQGVASPGRFEQIAVSALLAGTLLLSLWAANAKPRLMRTALIVAAAVVATSIIASIAGNVDGVPTRIANLLLVTLAPPATVIGVVRSLRGRRRVSLEAVFGVLCLYLLLGMFFAFAYGTVDRIGETGFFAQDVRATAANFQYFSFTTLTTVGYGDLTPGGNLGRTLANAEALVGQIYLVTIVAVIVGNLGRSREAQHSGEPQQGREPEY